MHEAIPLPGTRTARRSWRSGVLAIVASWVASCGGPTDSTQPPAGGSVASVQLTPGSESIVVGGGKQFTATVKDANNTVLTGRTVTWTSSNPSLATVSATGQVVGQYHGGPVTIRATVDGVVGTATVTVTAPQAPSVVEMRSVMDSAHAVFFRAAEATDGNAVAALTAAANFMDKDPRVKSVRLLDSTAIQIELKTGLLTVYKYDEVGADGLSLSRGGGAPNGLTGGALTRFGRAAKLVANRKVLFCAAWEHGFYKTGELNAIADIARNSGLSLEVTVLRGKQCNHAAVRSFGNYGLVIIDTHGFPNGFVLGDSMRVPSGDVTDEVMQAALDAENGPGFYEAIVSGDLGTVFTGEVGAAATKWWLGYRTNSVRWGVWATSQLVRKLQLPNTIVFGNMCHSGTSSGPVLPTGHIQPAFMSTGLISYYAYAFLDGASTKVENPSAIAMERNLLKALLVDGDSTLDAHGGETSDGVQLYLAGRSRQLERGPDGILFKPIEVGPPQPFYFRHFGHPDYSYVKVGITPDPTEGEFGKPIDFVAEDEGSAPANAIYEWDFGDGTPKVRVNGLPLVQHTFQPPNGTSACQKVSYPVKLELLNPASGTPVSVAKTEATAQLQASCPNWKVTTFVDVDELVDPPGTDPGQGGPLFDLLWGAESVPGSALITTSGNQLSMRVKRAGVWESCCQFGGDDHVWIWPTWSQSTTDLGSGTMTGVTTEGQSEFRFQATRNGKLMTGTMTLRVSSVDSETGQPRVSTYLFTFTAERMK